MAATRSPISFFRDGFLLWRQRVIQACAGWGDPALAFATDGTLIYSALVYDLSFATAHERGRGGLSRDGGANGQPVMVHYEDANKFFNDKEWIAAGAGAKFMSPGRSLNPTNHMGTFFEHS